MILVRRVAEDGRPLRGLGQGAAIAVYPAGAKDKEMPGCSSWTWLLTSSRKSCASRRLELLWPRIQDPRQHYRSALAGELPAIAKRDCSRHRLAVAGFIVLGLAFVLQIAAQMVE